MRSYQMKKLSELKEIHVKQAATIFADELIQYFQSICRDRKYLIEVFSQALVREKVLVCMLENVVVGVIIYNTLEDSLKMVKFASLKQAFGLIKGTIAYINLTRRPKHLKSGQVYLDMIITNPMYRYQGVATTMIEYICNTKMALEYTLDVSQDNLPAITLYKKLGFEIVPQTNKCTISNKKIDDHLYMIKTIK